MKVLFDDEHLSPEKHYGFTLGRGKKETFEKSKEGPAHSLKTQHRPPDSRKSQTLIQEKDGYNQS